MVKLDERLRRSPDLSKAVVASNGYGAGGIVFFTGTDITDAVTGSTDDIEDLGFSNAPAGLSIWEGYSENGADWPDLKGEFRSLTDAEWELIRLGKPPWNDDGRRCIRSGFTGAVQPGIVSIYDEVLGL